MSLKKLTREACMLRDGRCCRKCNTFFPKKGLQLHHVIPQRLKGPDEIFNLVCLCNSCHTEWHGHENKLGVTWDPKGSKEEFFRWLRSDQPEQDAQDLSDRLDEHLEDELRSLIQHLTRHRKKRKQARNLIQTNPH